MSVRYIWSVCKAFIVVSTNLSPLWEIERGAGAFTGIDREVVARVGGVFVVPRGGLPTDNFSKNPSPKRARKTHSVSPSNRHGSRPPRREHRNHKHSSKSSRKDQFPRCEHNYARDTLTGPQNIPALDSSSLAKTHNSK